MKSALAHMGAACALLLSNMANAALFDRGGGLIFDSEQNLNTRIRAQHATSKAGFDRCAIRCSFAKVVALKLFHCGNKCAEVLGFKEPDMHRSSFCDG